MDTRKILTIAIPTFNRASFLKNQLDFLSEEIIGFEDDCEIFVSDNCSDDETSVILEEFQQKLKSVTFQVWRNQQNVGAIKNIIHCNYSKSAGSSRIHRLIFRLLPPPAALPL